MCLCVFVCVCMCHCLSPCVCLCFCVSLCLCFCECFLICVRLCILATTCWREDIRVQPPRYCVGRPKACHKNCQHNLGQEHFFVFVSVIFQQSSFLSFSSVPCLAITYHPYTCVPLTRKWTRQPTRTTTQPQPPCCGKNQGSRSHLCIHCKLSSISQRTFL